jgi:hypothetical protein
MYILGALPNIGCCMHTGSPPNTGAGTNYPTSVSQDEFLYWYWDVNTWYMNVDYAGSGETANNDSNLSSTVSLDEDVVAHNTSSESKSMNDVYKSGGNRVGVGNVGINLQTTYMTYNSGTGSWDTNTGSGISHFSINISVCDCYMDSDKRVWLYVPEGSDTIMIQDDGIVHQKTTHCTNDNQTVVKIGPSCTFSVVGGPHTYSYCNFSDDYLLGPIRMSIDYNDFRTNDLPT